MVRRGNDSDRCRDRMVMDQVAGRGSDINVVRHVGILQDKREYGCNHVIINCSACYIIVLANEKTTFIYSLVLLPLRTQVPLFYTRAFNKL